MRVGKEDGFNVIYDAQGLPMCLPYEAFLSQTKGEFHNPKGTLDPQVGFLYISNKRIVFIGREMFVPSGGIPVAQIAQIATKMLRAKHDKKLKTRLYAEIRHEEVKRCKKTLLGNYVLFLTLNNKKYLVQVVPKKKEFKQVLGAQYSQVMKK